jgi:hypothetical protein
MNERPFRFALSNHWKLLLANLIRRPAIRGIARFELFRAVSFTGAVQVDLIC